MGINAIKNALSFVFMSIASAIDIDKNGDGKISFTEILSVATTVGLQFPVVYESFGDIKAEFKDLDAAEQAELIAYFREEFDLANDKVEQIVELVIEILYQNYTNVKELTALIRG